MLGILPGVVNINTMGSNGNLVEETRTRKPRFLCLHGFRTSAQILKKQIHKWPDSVRQKLDLVFVDAPFPAQGKSDVEGLFDPPYYEWFQFNKEFNQYTNFEECLDYIEQCMIKHGPIDGLLGFSQGAILSAALVGLQAEGVALTRVPKIKFLIIIGGAKLKHEGWAEKAYATPIQCLSLHFLGKEDFLRPYGEELLKSVVDPVVIHHPKGHTIPRIDDKALPTMHSFLDKIQIMISEEQEKERVMDNSVAVA
ncbi:hypothetical protein Cgig2_029448 [Carnegiea gigantea]|uniref:Serine hydrolase domain-containing protein n=1 Tax=Carnegiea gigantea TaxID=171969 RepID=A0A9Q1KIN0_9CARY|nr:hypothetical protein Cgig2_029448 [Carnegiea gigantea]